MSGLLLQTKLFKPTLRPALIARPQLIAKLNASLGNGVQGFNARLTLVSAPAGFGKTTLISAWIDALASNDNLLPKPQVAWLSLDRHDSELPHFLHYFIAAIRTVFPMACANTLDMLKRWPEPRLVLLATLSNDILSLPEPVILVLDDYHSLANLAIFDRSHGSLRFLYLDCTRNKNHNLVGVKLTKAGIFEKGYFRQG